jgi:hypothetical protein
MTRKTSCKVNAMSYAKLLKFMEHGDHTCAELAEMTGLHKLTIYSYCKAMHKEGVAHITRYEPDVWGRHTTIVYKLGAGKDAKRVRMNDVARQARYRAKIEAQRVALVMAGKAQFVPRANGRKLFKMLEAA